MSFPELFFWLFFWKVLDDAHARALWLVDIDLTRRSVLVFW
jgi:hypothetical protein